MIYYNCIDALPDIGGSLVKPNKRTINYPKSSDVVINVGKPLEALSFSCFTSAVSKNPTCQKGRSPIIDSEPFTTIILT